MTPISLIEELLLLTLEDSGGEFDKVPEIFLGCGIAGSALMDLALMNRIDSDLKALWVSDASPTGDDILDGVLAKIASEPDRLDVKTWMTRLLPEAMAMREAALARLCERGILRQREHSFLWVLKERRYPLIEGLRLVKALLTGKTIWFLSDIAYASGFIFDMVTQK